MKRSRAIFLDRDGVLNTDLGYVYRIEDLCLTDNVGLGLQKFKQLGFLLIVITNQSGVARGYFSLENVREFHHALSDRLSADFGILLDDYFICPHHPEGTVQEYSAICNCRKPKPGLVESAVAKWDIDLKHSYLIGDKSSDIDLAMNAGMPGIQVVGAKYESSPNAVFQAKDLLEAADYVALDLKEGA